MVFLLAYWIPSSLAGLTTGFLSDVTVQYIEIAGRNSRAQEYDQSECPEGHVITFVEGDNVVMETVTIDWGRVGRFMFLMAFTNTQFQVQLNFLNTYLPGATIMDNVKKMLINEFIFSPPQFATMVMLSTYMHDGNLDNSWPSIKTQVWPITWANAATYGVFDIFRFYLPPIVQVPIGNIIDYFFNMYLALKTNSEAFAADAVVVAHKDVAGHIPPESEWRHTVDVEIEDDTK
eukprot:PhM_4_TR12286/c0_g1_i2/m.56369/K13348/MPV17; protein Mpv17